MLRQCSIEEGWRMDFEDDDNKGSKGKGRSGKPIKEF
ncbi:hypothetical protein STIAU_4745, partial [Stigmatella aurantiaca DW4/3-1]